METSIPREDIEALRREKYDGNPDADMSADIARLSGGEPLAYVIGNVPFLGVSVELFSHPLIPRPETEWWTEELINHINEKTIIKNATIYSSVSTDTKKEVRVLDLCAGSGAIGLALLKHCPNVQVSFGELMEEHEAVIRKSIEKNVLDAARADIRIGDLFAPFKGETFDIIATNPPYIPHTRELEQSVTQFEPSEALFSGINGLDLIRRIYTDISVYLNPRGEVWMECDISNIEKASELAIEGGASHTKIRTDQYHRPRLLVAYY